MRYASIVLAFTLAVFQSVAADDRRVSLDDVLRMAWEKSPLLGDVDSMVSNRLGDAEETRVKQNPSLDTEARLPTNRNGSEAEYEVKVSQPLRVSDFGFRAKLSALIRDSASIERKIALIEFTQGLVMSYSRAWALQERRRVLVGSQGLAQEALGKLRDNAERGFLSEGDVAVFEGEVQLFAAEVVGADAELKRAAAALTRSSGAEVANAIYSPPPEPRRPDLAEVVRQAQENALPVQERSALLARIASKQLELARLDAYPRFAPGVGYERTDDGAHQVVVGFSIDLPFFDRNEAAQVRAIGAERAASRLRDYATSGRLVDEAQMLFEASVALSEQRQRFEKHVIPAREKALRGYRKQFEVGQGTAFQVWQVQRDLTDARLRSLDLWSEERTVMGELAILLGTDL